MRLASEQGNPNESVRPRAVAGGWTQEAAMRLIAFMVAQAHVINDRSEQSADENRK